MPTSANSARRTHHRPRLDIRVGKISHSALGLDESRLCGIALQFPSQAQNQNINAAIIELVVMDATG